MNKFYAALQEHFNEGGTSEDSFRKGWRACLAQAKELVSLQGRDFRDSVFSAVEVEAESTRGLKISEVLNVDKAIEFCTQHGLEAFLFATQKLVIGRALSKHHNNCALVAQKILRIQRSALVEKRRRFGFPIARKWATKEGA